MTREPSPPLSAILVTPGSFEAIRKSIDHLRAQNVRDRIEVVIVAPSEAELRLEPGALAEFGDWQVVPVGAIPSLGPALAAGVRRARGVVVVYVEEHSYPEPGWAEALIDAHAGPWGAVGPAVVVANPDSPVSLVNSFIDFGPWSPSGAPGPMPGLPLHQTSYKRALLIEYGTRHDALLTAEWELQKDLLEQGHELYFQPAARTRHVNVSRLTDAMTLEFHNFRVTAANRALEGNWPWLRRALYVAGSPLVPLLHFARVVRNVRRSGELGRMPVMLPPLIPILVSAAAGEAMGFFLGEGGATRRQLTFELDRLRHITDQDQRTLSDHTSPS
jgi:hypothetical protein